MPKAPRTSQVDVQRHNPLAEDYSPSSALRQKTPKKRKQRNEDDGNDFVDTKASRKILSLGQDLANEEEQREQALRGNVVNDAFALDSRLELDSQSEEDEDQYGEEEVWMDEEEQEVDLEVRHRWRYHEHQLTVAGYGPARSSFV
jgi:essential nuclear protein 1